MKSKNSVAQAGHLRSLTMDPTQRGFSCADSYPLLTLPSPVHFLGHFSSVPARSSGPPLGPARSSSPVGKGWIGEAAWELFVV